jgi:hypothetical protein
VRDLPEFSQSAFLSGAAAAFDVIPGEETTAQAVEARLQQLSVGEDGQPRVVFGLRAAGKRGPTWLVLKPIVDLSALGPPALRSLDCTVLHGVLLGPLLGIDAAAMAKQSNLLYTHDTSEALARVDAGEVQAAFLMNATSVSQVLDACEQGHVLPQKSTYFQPKLATGLVMYQVERATLSR